MLLATAGPVTPPTMPPATAPAGPPIAPPETAPTPAPLNLSPVVEQAARLSAAKPAKTKLRKDIDISRLLLCSTGHRRSRNAARRSLLIFKTYRAVQAVVVDLDQLIFPKSLSSWKPQTIRPDGLHRQTE